MNFLLGRDGNISIIRVGTIAAILGVLIIVGGILLFLIDRASHQTPLDIAPYPSATLWYTADHSNISRSVYYQIPGASADDVAAYYQNKMRDFYGTNDEQCVRLPAAGNFPDYDKGVKDVAPFQFSCMFDHSGFEISQYTRVNIQPGIASNNTDGMVIVEYEQSWQR
jgi:hypothetical protein